MKLLTALSVLPIVALGSTLATDYTADRSLRVERRIHTTSEVVPIRIEYRSQRALAVASVDEPHRSHLRGYLF